MSDSDEALAGQAAAGDRAALEALLGRHYDTVYRIAWRWCGHQQDAQDIAQETCLRIARGIRAFDGRSAFRTWLYRITVNAARDAYRRGRREALHHIDGEATAGEAALTVDGGAESAIDLDRAWAALDALPGPQREAVLLVHVEGLSHGEAARALSCAETTVSWRIFQARRRLRAGLDLFATEEAS